MDNSQKLSKFYVETLFLFLTSFSQKTIAAFENKVSASLEEVSNYYSSSEDGIFQSPT